MPSVQIDSDSLNAPAINLINGSGDPTAPGSGHAKLYVKSGGVYVLLDTGPAVAVGGSPALAEGQLAVGDGSGILSALALGDEGQVVTADVNGMATWDDPPEAGAADGGPHVTILPPAYSAINGGLPGWSSWSAQPFYGVWKCNNTDATGWVDYKVYLYAGTYTVMLYATKGTDQPILDVLLDGSSIGTIDQYAGSHTQQQRTELTGVVVATSGLKTLRFASSSKHASSTSYKAEFNWISIWRTA